MRSVVRSRDIEAVRAQLSGLGPNQIADELRRLDLIDQAVVFRTLAKDTALDVFESIDPPHQRRLLDSLTADEVTDIFTQLDTDDRARLLDEMPAKVASRLLEQTSPTERAQIALLLGYPSETAGRLMGPEYVSATATTTVDGALDKIRTSGYDGDAIYVIYVLDDERRLIGTVALADLVLGAPNSLLDEIMSVNPVRVSTIDDQEDVGRRVLGHGLLAVPVVDREDRLVGVVALDDALGAARSRAHRGGAAARELVGQHHGDDGPRQRVAARRAPRLLLVADAVRADGLRHHGRDLLVGDDLPLHVRAMLVVALLQQLAHHTGALGHALVERGVVEHRPELFGRAGEVVGHGQAHGGVLIADQRTNS